MRVITKVGLTALAIVFLLVSCTSPLVDQVRTAVTVARGPKLTLANGTTALASGGTADFGQVTVGSSRSVTLTITNSGRADLTLSGGAASVSLGGANMDQFAISAAPSAAIVAVGQSTSFTLTFTPTSAGAKTATIAVASNDPSTNSFTFTVTGTGVNNGKVATPTFPGSQPGISYGDDISVTITCATPGATIYYTTNGLMPTTSSAVYVNPIDVKNDKARVHIIAVAVKAGMDNSDPLSGEFSIDYTVPGTPLNLAAAPGYRQVTLSWYPAARANSYNVYYAPGSTVTMLDTKVAVSGTPCTVTGLADGTEYAFIVTGVNNSVSPIVEGGPSYPASTATTQPAAPALPSAVAGLRQVTVSWGAVTGATSYNLYYAQGTSVDKTGTQVPGVVTPQIVNGLANATQYAFAVTANNAAGESAVSPVATATTQTIGAPSAPTSSTGATWINAAQSAGITITVGGLATTGAVVGDTLTLFLNGGSIATHTLTASEISNGVPFSVNGATLGVGGTARRASQRGLPISCRTWAR